MTNTNDTALATRAANTPAPAPVYGGSIQAFDDAQRKAKSLAAMSMLPPAYQGQNGLANCLWALELASQMGLSPLTVIMNVTPVHGKPAWSSAFLIARVNSDPRFGRMRFVLDDPAQPSSCYAVAKEIESGEDLVGECITMAMAQAEGWVNRNGSKWKTMPGQMLRYRAATFWCRIYAPEFMTGIRVEEELIDVEPVAVQEVTPAPVCSTPPPNVEVLPDDDQQAADVPDQALQENGYAVEVVDTRPAQAPDPKPEKSPTQLIEAQINSTTTVSRIELAVQRLGQLQREGKLTDEQTAAMLDLAESRRKELVRPITAAARKRALQDLTQDAEDGFRRVFGVAEDRPTADAICQRQHMLWLEAKAKAAEVVE